MGREFRGEDSCIRMAESLYFSPETVTTFLIGSTLIQNKNSFKNKQNKQLSTFKEKKNSDWHKWSHLMRMLSTTNWHLPVNCALALAKTIAATKAFPSVSAEIEPYAAAADDLWLPLRVIQGKGWVTVLQRNWLQQVLDRYFLELISWSQSLHLFVSRKAPNPFMWHQFLRTSRIPLVK